MKTKDGNSPNPGEIGISHLPNGGTLSGKSGGAKNARGNGMADGQNIQGSYFPAFGFGGPLSWMRKA
jgi:hypothetical protein